MGDKSKKLSFDERFQLMNDKGQSCYEGTEEKTGAEMNVIKDKIFEGPVREQIDRSVVFLATQIKERTYLGADRKFTTEVEYPEFVRQEMIVNACCHRDLSITGTDIQVKLFDEGWSLKVQAIFRGLFVLITFATLISHVTQDLHAI